MWNIQETTELFSEVYEKGHGAADSFGTALSGWESDEILRHAEVWSHVDQLYDCFLDSEFAPGPSRLGIGRMVPIVPRLAGEFPILASAPLARECRAASLSAMRIGGLVMATGIRARKQFPVEQAAAKSLNQREAQLRFAWEINNFAVDAGTLAEEGDVAGKLITDAGLAAAFRINRLASGRGVRLPIPIENRSASMLGRCLLFHAAAGWGGFYSVAEALYKKP